jgi:hypothetical protein
MEAMVPFLKVLTQHAHGGTEKNPEKLVFSRDSNQVPPVCKSGI